MKWCVEMQEEYKLRYRKQPCRQLLIWQRGLPFHHQFHDVVEWAPISISIKKPAQYA